MKPVVDAENFGFGIQANRRQMMQEEEEAQRKEKERQIELAFKKSPVIPNFSLNYNPE